MLNNVQKEKTMRTAILAAIAAICLGLVASSTVSAAPAYGASMGAAAASLDSRPQQQKPNILVIMADDIGCWNISAYNRGMMGYRTPNIDRIANEGAIFTVAASCKLPA